MCFRPEDLDRSWQCHWHCCSHSLQCLLQALQTTSSGLLDSTRETKPNIFFLYDTNYQGCKNSSLIPSFALDLDFRAKVSYIQYHSFVHKGKWKFLLQQKIADFPAYWIWRSKGGLIRRRLHCRRERFHLSDTLPAGWVVMVGRGEGSRFCLPEPLQPYELHLVMHSQRTLYGDCSRLQFLETSNSVQNADDDGNYCMFQQLWLLYYFFCWIDWIHDVMLQLRVDA